MKAFLFILFFVLVGCDPYNFGFKENPAQILTDAFNAIESQDTKAFLKVSGKEALCLYGNGAGLSFLKRHAEFKKDDVKFDLDSIKSTYYQIPDYVGYWSYYNERYIMNVNDVKTNDTLIQAVVDCDYGSDDERNAKFINQKRSKYPRKGCKVTKIIPHSFDGLKMTSRCQILKVNVSGKKKP